jgi:hypothetical protein
VLHIESRVCADFRELLRGRNNPLMSRTCGAAASAGRPTLTTNCLLKLFIRRGSALIPFAAGPHRCYLVHQPSSSKQPIGAVLGAHRLGSLNMNVRNGWEAHIWESILGG